VIIPGLGIDSQQIVHKEKKRKNDLRESIVLARNGSVLRSSFFFTLSADQSIRKDKGIKVSR